MNSNNHDDHHGDDYVIIVAGGKGLRMGTDLPKQFLPLGGIPVLMRTLMRFHEYSPRLSIIVVLPPAQHDYWQALCRQHQCRISHRLAPGGPTRYHSVQSGLALIPDDARGVVGVHDGVRPFVSTAVISRCYQAARAAKAAAPAVPVVETLRQLTDPAADGHTSRTVPRHCYRLVQTPQCFDIQLFKAACRQQPSDSFTDDASVVEAYGHPVTLVEGNRENIKLTTPFDLGLAEFLFRQNT